MKHGNLITGKKVDTDNIFCVGFYNDRVELESEDRKITKLTYDEFVGLFMAVIKELQYLEKRNS